MIKLVAESVSDDVSLQLLRIPLLEHGLGPLHRQVQQVVQRRVVGCGVKQRRESEVVRDSNRLGPRLDETFQNPALLLDNRSVNR
jgi:hypothetical protein